MSFPSEARLLSSFFELFVEIFDRLVKLMNLANLACQFCFQTIDAPAQMLYPAQVR
jgi:hypothetical protein